MRKLLEEEKESSSKQRKLESVEEESASEGSTRVPVRTPQPHPTHESSLDCQGDIPLVIDQTLIQLFQNDLHEG
ncbi:hypothetical protein AC249_AIPGENE12642 [Exaiptasia diaphana]|nr:hypothetical protein AC249_AIPGENE12642 [Exaiptasia diaphana]